MNLFDFEVFEVQIFAVKFDVEAWYALRDIYGTNSFAGGGIWHTSGDPPKRITQNLTDATVVVPCFM